MKFTDPNGEFIHLIIGAIIGGTINWIANGAKFSWEGLGYFGIGAVAGALAAGVGSGIMAAQAGSTFGAGFMGTQSAMTAISASYSTSFISGATIGGASSFSSGFIKEAGNSWMKGDSFGDGLWSGFKGGIKSGIQGAAIGGVLGGLDAASDNRKFWNGDRKFNESGRTIPRYGNVRENAEEFVNKINDGMKGEIIGSPQQWKVDVDLDNIDIYDVEMINRWKYVQYNAKVSYISRITNVVSGESFLDLQNVVFDNITSLNYISFRYLFNLYKTKFY